MLDVPEQEVSMAVCVESVPLVPCVRYRIGSCVWSVVGDGEGGARRTLSSPQVLPYAVKVGNPGSWLCVRGVWTDRIPVCVCTCVSDVSCVGTDV